MRLRRSTIDLNAVPEETAVAVPIHLSDAPRRCDPAGPARVVGWGQGGLE